jgi:hypothetical protein
MLLIIGWMTLLKSRMPKIPKDFPSSNCYKQLVFWKVKPYDVHKMQRRLPTKDLTTSTHLGFHTMVVNVQPNRQNPNGKKVFKNEPKNCILKLI